MRNIFFKSVIRQPERTMLLVLLIGVASFAFVARVTEFIVVSNEIRRIEGFYRSIGFLNPVNPVNVTQSHDVSHAADLIGASELVGFEDRRVFTQGILYDRVNTTSNLRDGRMIPVFEGLDIHTMEHYFIGTVISQFWDGQVHNMGGVPMISRRIDVSEVLLGDLNVMFEGDREFVNEWGQVAVVRANMWFMLPITQEEAELFSEGLFDPLYGLESGGPSLFRAIPWSMSADSQTWMLRPLRGDDGLARRRVYFPDAEEGFPPYGYRETVDPELRDDNLQFFVNANDAAAMEAIFTYMANDMELAAANLSSITVTGTADMSAIPRLQNRMNASLWLERQGSRWLTHEDYLNSNPVAVVPVSLAARRQMSLGDTFTITLRESTQPQWLDQETNSPFAIGLENWWQTYPAGWWSTIPSSEENWRDARTHEITLEVVGVFDFNHPVRGRNNFTSAEIFIPASLIPEGFEWDDMPLLTGMYSFVLNSPRDEEAFLRQNQSLLNMAGFTVSFMPNDFDIFLSAADPISMSITLNLAIFTVVSVFILVLVAFLYLRQWQKSLAITRALGVPSNKALKQLLSPVLFIWTPVIIIGSVAAWFFALAQAENTLAGFGDIYDTAVRISFAWFFILPAALIALIFGGVIAMGLRIARRPVLEQLQDNVQTRRAYIPSGEVDFVLGKINLKYEKLATSRKNALSASWSFITRHIFRAPVKSLLAAGLALFFVLSLGWLNYTIIFTQAEIERLFDETIVTAQIIRNPEDGRHPIEWEYFGHITRPVIDLFDGFATDMYLESVWPLHNSRIAWLFMYPDDRPPLWMYTQTKLGISSLEELINDNTRTPMDDYLGVVGYDMQIEFFPGFSAEDFVFEGGVHESGVPMPVIVPQGFIERLGRDGFAEWNWEEYRLARSPLTAVQIIGTYSGGLTRGIGRFPGSHIIMPIEGKRYYLGGHWLSGAADLHYGRLLYHTARITIDPSRNRELYRLREITEMALANNDPGGRIGAIPLEMFMDDSILINVVEPLEQNLALLRVLYPIAIGVAIVLSVGLSLLIMLQNAKNAAIMRVLGKPKATAQLALCVEPVIICIVGVLLGLAALFVIGVTFEITPFAMAGMYLAGALIGSAVGAFIISAKTPLELLQVKE